MKHLLPLTLSTILLCCLITTTPIVAQSAASKHAAVRASSSKTHSATEEQQNLTTYLRTGKRLPALYSGYVIELDLAVYPLDRKNPLFRQFGNVFFDKLPEGGYSYCIMANFSSVQAIEQYVEKMILHRAPEARVIEYRNGKRKLL